MIAFEHGNAVCLKIPDVKPIMCITGIIPTDDGMRYVCEWMEDNQVKVDVFEEDSLSLYEPVELMDSYYMDSFQ
jgi:uncharacterized protein YodC (DUF2158 family)